MRRLSILAMVLACGACQPLPEATVAGTTAAAENPTAQPAAAEPACSSYTDKTKPTLSDLYNIAWVLETSKNRRAIGFTPWKE